MKQLIKHIRMNKVGRPTKYREEFPDMLYEHMKAGLSLESFGGKIGVSEETIHQWKNKQSRYFHKKFSEAYKKGLTASLLHWEEMGHDMVLAGQGNATTWIFNMKNRFGWKDKKEIEQSGQIDLNVKKLEDIVDDLLEEEKEEIGKD